MQITLRHLLLAFFASLALHAVAGVWWLPQPQAGALGPGEGGLLISLGAAGGEPSAAPPAQETTADKEETRQPEAVAPPAKTAPEIPETAAEDDSEDGTAAAEPKASPSEAGRSATLEMPSVAERPTELPTARPASLPALPPAPRPAETQEAAVPPTLPPATAETGAATATSPGSGGTANAPASGGAAGAYDAYLAELMAWLAKHKSYPAMAERRRQEGTSEIAFVLARDGSLLSYELARSSGHALLDEASAEMLRRAAPLPPIPPDIGEDRIRITVPVVFQLQ